MRIPSPIRLAAALGVLAAWQPAPASADDRNLLRETGADPYVMVLFDTSGSMNWAPRCTQEDYDTFYDHDQDPVTPDVRRCNFVCEPRDCPVPRDGDDPASKLRQAKEALYEVIRTVGNISFGFASFNQDGLHVADKHWLYVVNDSQAAGFFDLNGRQFPAAGGEYVFGPRLSSDPDRAYGCDRAGDDNQSNNDYDNYERACYPDDAADLDNVWDRTKERRVPKLGGPSNWNTTVTTYVRAGNTRYRVRYLPVSGEAPPAAEVEVDVEVRTCTNFDNNDEVCGSLGSATTRRIAFSRVGDFVMWDYTVDRTPPENGYFGAQFSDTTGNNNTCEGWEPNTDTWFGAPSRCSSSTDDIYCDGNSNWYNLKRDSVADPSGRTLPPGADAADFTYGDVLPLDWLGDNKLAILNRLAPRLNGGDPASDPEAFGVATYLENSRQGTRQFLRALNDQQKPLVPNGSTPLLASMTSFRNWFRGCNSGSCPGTVGWDDVAAVQDPDWECRKKFLIILTDGDDTCAGGSGCPIAATLHDDDDITTYVVAFGVEGVQGNRLSCIAEEGGTGEPIYPQNKLELVQALTDIFSEIREESAAFASAAVPTVQANVSDKIFLSSFVPLNDAAVWPGRVDSFLKPLPLDESGLPDRGEACGADGTAGCWLWDAGDSQPAWNGDAGYAPAGLLLQAPLADDITDGDNGTLQIGTGINDRRVFFGLPNESVVAGKRQYFRFPVDQAEQNEFEYLWWEADWPGPIATGDADNLAQIQKYVRVTLAEKQGEITDPDTGVVSRVQYLMGDIFHADPGLLDQPENFDFYTKDLYRNSALCGQTVEQTNQRNPPVSYRFFADRNACRRKILFIASNDGQLHAFDSGIFDGTDCKFPVTEDRDGNGAPDGDGDPIEGEFDNGTGRELFSYIPSQMMPFVRDLVTEDDLAGSGEWGIDGTVRIADVFIDPELTGGVPTCAERQWRTVLVGGYREGGPGYYALDITQPDLIDDATNVPAPLGGDSGYVPSCTEGGDGCGPLPFPAKLWEFKDSSDEDGSGVDDIGESWSRPVIERLRICTADCGSDTQVLEDRFVAIFGGGLPDNPANTDTNPDTVGNWLYMVDVETGEILYKRGGVARVGATDSIVGAVPGDIATVDFNGNGYIDRLYFGTTAGYLYKVDLGEGPFELDLEGRIADPSGEEGRYDPFQVFSTGGRPIYFEPTAIYLPKLRALGIAFGTGDRWNLWSFNAQEGRFYVIADLNWTDVDRDGVVDEVCGGCPQPLTESVYQAVGPDDSFDPLAPPPDYLLDTSDATPGWYITLAADDRVITEAFSLSGITIFTAYAPRQTEEEGVCALGGESKIFVVGTANAIGYARAAGATSRTRYTTAPTFTTAPFVEQSSTQNEPHGPGGDPDAGPPLCGTAELLQVREELKGLFPPSCRFAFYNKNIETVRSDTGLICIAPVPVCIEQHNWKEF